MLQNLKRYAHYGLLVICALGAAAAAWSWYHPRVETTPGAVRYVKVPEERTVTKIRRVLVAGPKRIVTIYKPVIVKKLDLPKAVANNPDLQVTADADVGLDRTDCPKYSVVSIMNTLSGETSIIAKRTRTPLFSFEDQKEIGLRYGLSSTAGQVWELYGRWTFFRVGRFYTAAYGEINQQPEAKALLEESYRW